MPGVGLTQPGSIVKLVAARQPVGERLGPGAGVGVVAVDAALDDLL